MPRLISSRSVKKYSNQSIDYERSHGHGVPHNPALGILGPGQGKSRMGFTECVGGVLYLSADSISC